MHRSELMRLIAESGEGDIVLVEQIDRLARLKQSDWDTLKQKLASKRLAIVSPELPTSWLALQQHSETYFTGTILQAVNAMMLDMLAAVARKDMMTGNTANHRESQRRSRMENTMGVSLTLSDIST
ncbi:recombinase family protein [Escherichia coli]|uniref:recombinase family protein n=1 Tax=Escherichia coli TaxID=562 RepID=UPI001FCEDDAD|nr:recombinase family protein [Escherichia coli]